MKILALETSAVAASVALCEDEKLLGEYTLINGNTHSETLLPMVENLLSKFGLTPREIDLFAVSAGPGSFTGVRIGVATVKGLAFGSEKPCVGVSTLEALAGNLPIPGALICPVMNARRNQFYTALFRFDGEKPVRLTPDSALSYEELDRLLDGYDEPVYPVGDGKELAEKLLRHPLGFVPDRLSHQSAANVALTALRAFRDGNATTDEALAPVYLRPCQAERERAERLSNTESAK